MARKILFRGKGCGSGEWFYGDLIHKRIWGNDVVVIRTEDSGFDNYVEYEVIPETVGQYTGLTDKNGQKIFEGDICSTDLFIPYKTVVFRNGCFMYELNDGGSDYYDIMMPIDKEYSADVYTEVIGNIHE